MLIGLFGGNNKLSKLIVKKNKLICNDQTFEIDDLFTNELYQLSSKKVEEYNNELSVVNETYLTQVLPALALSIFIENNQVESIMIEEQDDILCPIIVDIARKHNIKVKGFSPLFKITSNLIGHFFIIVSTIYILFKMVTTQQTNDIGEQKKFSIIRTPAAEKKMDFLKMDIEVHLEGLTGQSTVYSCFQQKERIVWVLKAWLKSYIELAKYDTAVKNRIGTNSGKAIYKFYSKRIVHTILYSIMLEKFFSIKAGSTFYTGNNLDRFAIIEEKLAKRYNIKTICIPHGLEYGFKLPYCFTGDCFYTTSSETARQLNLLYDTEKFIYDKEITRKMFEVPQTPVKRKVNREIVFFTEPKEVYINLKIIEELLPFMERESLKLHIKLHPKDKKKNYEKYTSKISFIEDFNDAISNNICFSRKSTTLLEGIYNNSVSAAILTNSKDIAVFNTFPSLQDEKIKVFYNIEGLYEWIKREQSKIREL